MSSFLQLQTLRSLPSQQSLCNIQLPPSSSGPLLVLFPGLPKSTALCTSPVFYYNLTLNYIFFLCGKKKPVKSKCFLELWENKQEWLWSDRPPLCNAIFLSCHPYLPWLVCLQVDCGSTCAILILWGPWSYWGIFQELKYGIDRYLLVSGSSNRAAAVTLASLKVLSVKHKGEFEKWQIVGVERRLKWSANFCYSCTIAQGL